MNVERMLAVASAIEQETIPRIGFNMQHYAEIPGSELGTYRLGVVRIAKECGAVCCIAGWACILFGEPKSLIHGDEAKALLDLSYDQHRRLFYNDRAYIGFYGGHPGGLAKIPREAAVAAIRRMVREEGPQVEPVQVEEAELVCA